MNDEQIIEIIARKMSDEVGWSEASKVFNHYSFIDVVTHLFCEKGLRDALLYAYAEEISLARTMELDRDLTESYAEWKADVATRGGC